MKEIFRTRDIKQIFGCLNRRMYLESFYTENNICYIGYRHKSSVDVRTIDETVDLMINNLTIKDCQVFNPIYLMSLLDKSILPISCQEQTEDNYCVSVSKDYVNIMSKNEVEYYIKNNISILEELIEQNKENYRKILKDMFYTK